MELAGMKWTEVKDLDFPNWIVLVPLGSIEQHSWHLPLSVDTDVITELAQRVERARPQRVMLLPTLWLGHSPHHRFFACLSLDVRTYMDVIVGLCDSLILPGFRKILFLNGHGGNEIAAKAALREVKSKYENNHDLKIGFASYWALGHETVRQVRESPLGGVGHACEMETSLMLYLKPASVDMSRAQTGGPIGTEDPYRLLDAQYGRPVYFVDEFSEVSENGAIGQPELGTADKGEKFVGGFTREVIQFIDEFAKW
jgi:creatinine amidohydrolase